MTTPNSELWSRVAALYRAELAQEVTAGFPRLRRIPNTQTIRLVDYLTGLDPAAQAALLDALAHFNAAAISPELYAAEAAERQQHPHFGRLLAALAFRDLTAGYRYTPIKILSGLDKKSAPGWLEELARSPGHSALELQPRAELLPDLDCVQPVKPARLKKLLDKAFARLFAPQKIPLGNDACKYVGVHDPCRLTVDVLFAPPARMNPRQLQYVIKVAAAEDPKESCATYEGLWSQHATWDYLTEENVERSIELLTDLIVYLIGFLTRLRAVMSGRP